MRAVGSEDDGPPVDQPGDGCEDQNRCEEHGSHLRAFGYLSRAPCRRGLAGARDSEILIPPSAGGWEKSDRREHEAPQNLQTRRPPLRVGSARRGENVEGRVPDVDAGQPLPLRRRDRGPASD